MILKGERPLYVKEPRVQQRLSHFVAHCKRRGLSVTHQRLAVYEALLASPDHPTAEQIFKRVRQRYPTISLATVYKTLDTLESEGLISKITFLPDAARYDANIEHHHHLVCVRCHRVDDLPAALLERVKIPDDAAKDYRILGVSVQFHGLCSRCQRRGRKS